MQQNGVNTRVTEKDFQAALRRRIFAENRFYLFPYGPEHTPLIITHRERVQVYLVLGHSSFIMKWYAARLSADFPLPRYCDFISCHYSNGGETDPAVFSVKTEARSL